MSLKAKFAKARHVTVYHDSSMFKQRTAYKINVIERKGSVISDQSLVVNFRCNDLVAGFYYLPNKYINDPSTKLTDEDIKESNTDIGKGHSWYLSHDGYVGGQVNIQFYDEEDVTKLNMPIFEGEPPTRSPVKSPMKRGNNSLDEPKNKRPTFE